MSVKKEQEERELSSSFFFYCFFVSFFFKSSTSKLRRRKETVYQKKILFFKRSLLGSVFVFLQIKILKKMDNKLLLFLFLLVMIVAAISLFNTYTRQLNKESFSRKELSLADVDELFVFEDSVTSKHIFVGSTTSMLPASPLEETTSLSDNTMDSTREYVVSAGASSVQMLERILLTYFRPSRQWRTQEGYKVVLSMIDVSKQIQLTVFENASSTYKEVFSSNLPISRLESLCDIIRSPTSSPSTTTIPTSIVIVNSVYMARSLFTFRGSAEPVHVFVYDTVFRGRPLSNHPRNLEFLVGDGAGKRTFFYLLQELFPFCKSEWFRETGFPVDYVVRLWHESGFIFADAAEIRPTTLTMLPFQPKQTFRVSDVETWCKSVRAKKVRSERKALLCKQCNNVPESS